MKHPESERVAKPSPPSDELIGRYLKKVVYDAEKLWQPSRWKVTAATALQFCTQQRAFLCLELRKHAGFVYRPSTLAKILARLL